MSLVGITRHPLSEPDLPVCRHPAPHLRMFENLSSWECSSMELVVAVLTEDQCFSILRCHHLLPKRFSFCYIFQFSHMMHLKWPFRRFTVLASLPVESFGDFREAQRPEVPVKLDIELWVVRCWFSEVFESKDTDVAGLLLSFDDELETLLRL